MPEPLHRRVQFLLLKGAAPEDIMDIEQITPSEYGRAIARITRTQIDAVYAQQVLELELQRLDVLQQAYWEQAAAGSFDHLAAVLNIMRKRAQYLGLDAPTTVQQNTSTFVDVLASLSTHPAVTHRETPENGQLN